MNQHTLASIYSFEGKGLHTGKYSHVCFRPAPEGTGIVFIRTDLGGVQIPARADRVVSTRRSTMLGRCRARVGTVEHALSALYGLGVDNAFIEIDGPEMPILDGSASSYVAAFAAVEQQAPRKWVVPGREIMVRNERSGAWVKIAPSDRPSFSLTIDFNSAVVGKHTITYDENSDYPACIAPCRTFCFTGDILPQLMLGLIKGGDISNALVAVEKPLNFIERFVVSRRTGLSRDAIPRKGFLGNPELRFPDECARHKMLDFLGDISLCGGFLKAAVTAYKPGHAINTSAAKEILKNI